MVAHFRKPESPEGNQFGVIIMRASHNWTMASWNLLISSIKQITKRHAGMKAAIGMEAQLPRNIDGPLGA